MSDYLSLLPIDISNIVNKYHKQCDYIMIFKANGKYSFIHSIESEQLLGILEIMIYKMQDGCDIRKMFNICVFKGIYGYAFELNPKNVGEIDQKLHFIKMINIEVRKILHYFDISNYIDYNEILYISNADEKDSKCFYININKYDGRTGIYLHIFNGFELKSKK